MHRNICHLSFSFSKRFARPRTATYSREASTWAKTFSGVYLCRRSCDLPIYSCCTLCTTHTHGAVVHPQQQQRLMHSPRLGNERIWHWLHFSVPCQAIFSECKQFIFLVAPLQQQHQRTLRVLCWVRGSTAAVCNLWGRCMLGWKIISWTRELQKCYAI